MNNNSISTSKTINWLTTLLLVMMVSALVSGCGAEEPEVYQVGVLSGVDTFNSTIDGFKAKMAELGYAEGENITYDIQAAGGDSEKMKQIAEKFASDEVDLIFTTTTGGVKAAKAATAGAEIPVVFAIVLDPLGSGVVDDLREPGGNITGVSRPLIGFMGKRIEYLHQMAPEAKQVWVPYRPDYATSEVMLETLRPVAQSLGLELIETPVNGAQDVVAELGKDSPGFDSVLIMPDPIIQSAASWDAMLAYANEHQLPIVANVPGQARQGALFAYSDNNFETGQIAAPLADKILKGADPATIPVAFGEPRLFINYQVAQALGLAVEDSLLTQAEEVYQ